MKKKLTSCALVFAMILGLLQGILPDNAKPIGSADAAINFDSVANYPFGGRHIREPKFPLKNPIFTTVSEGRFEGANQYYTPSFFNNQGHIADIVVRNDNGGNPYTATAMCVDIDALSVRGDNHKAFMSMWGPSNNTVIGMFGDVETYNDNVKPFLDFFYYTTHIVPSTPKENLSPEEKTFAAWSDGKRIAMGVLTQNVVWLWQKPDFRAKSADEQKRIIAEEMHYAIAKINEFVTPKIQNGTVDYTVEECKKTIDYILNMETNLANQAVYEDRIKDRFNYYLVQNTQDNTDIGNNNVGRTHQRYLLPAYRPKIDTLPVFIKFQKVDADTGTGLQGAKFKVTPKGLNAMVDTITTGSDGWGYKTFLVPKKNTNYTFNIKEVQAPPGYINTGLDYNIVARNPDNDTQDKAATTTPSQIKNKKPIPELRDVDIIKKDMHTGQNLDGATFKMTGPNGSFNVITTQDGPKFQCVNPAQPNYIAPGSYTVEEITPPLGYELDKTNPNAQTITFTAKEHPVGSNTFITETSGQLIFTNPKKSEINLYKISATNTPLPGARFEIMKDGTVIGTEVTDGAGMITLRDVESGTYTFTETDAPTGYELPKDASDRVHTIKVDNRTGQSEYTITAINHQKKKIIVRKYAEDGVTMLPGAEFRIEKDGQLIGSKTTNGAGEIELEHAGTGFYTFTEVTAPDGYVLPLPAERVVGIYIDAEDPNEEYHLSAINYKYPEIRLRKLSADDNPQKPLKDALFKCYIEGKVFGEFFTDSNGEINIKYNDSVDADGRPVKGYKRFLDDINHPLQHEWQVRFEEITPPDGYLLAEPSWQENTIVKGQVLSDFAFTNSKYPEIVVLKQDSSTSKPLAGTVFNVMIDGQSLPGTWVTDDNGIIRINYENYNRFLGDLGNPNRSWTVTVTEVTPTAHYFDAGILTPKVQTGELRLGHRLTTFTFKNEPHPDLIVHKKSTKTDEPLPGVTYELVSENHAHKRTAVTNFFGEAKFENVAEGTYTLREIDVPNGIVVSERAYTIVSEPSLDGHKQVIEIFYANSDAPTLRIVKVDSETGAPLAGVKFNIKYVADKQKGAVTDYGDFFTDKNGEIYFNAGNNLPEGWYTITEIKPPQGYDYHPVDGKEKTIYLKGDRDYEHKVRNMPLPSIQILKVDEITGEPIADTEFSVKKLDCNSCDSINGTYTTDKDGIIYIPNATKGVYEIVETKAHEDYLRSDEKHTITVKGIDMTTLKLTNKRASGVIIYKIDKDTKEALQGAEFLLQEICDSNCKKAEYTIVTNDKGRAEFKNIKPGKYKIREIKAPDGYMLDNKEKELNIPYGKVTTITWENTARKGQIQILKLSKGDSEQTGLPEDSKLEGAVFNIYNNRSGKEVGQMITNSEGLAVSKPLPLGQYKVVEIIAPKHYQLNEKELIFDLEYENQIIKKEFYNKPVDLSLNVDKRGSKMSRPGNPMNYFIENVANNSNVALESFYIRDMVPYQYVTIQNLRIGKFSHPQKYDIYLKTTSGRKLQVSGNLNTSKPQFVDLKPYIGKLQKGEAISDIVLAFGKAPSKFRQLEPINMEAIVNKAITKKECFFNRVDVGGMYQDEWVVQQDTWKTCLNIPNGGGTTGIFPNTGY